MSNDDRRRDDERIEKILESVNLIKISMETFHQKCAGDMALNAQINKEHEEKLRNFATTLYDSENGICKTVQIDHMRISLISKIMWGIGGAVIVLVVNTFGKLILR